MKVKIDNKESLITLYHVSYNTNEPLHKEFVPRVPQNTSYAEDNHIKRICFSDSILGCLRSKDYSPIQEDNTYIDIIVWEYNFTIDNNILDWYYLYSNNLVPDAAITHEYWYTEKIVLDGSKYRISNIEYRTMYIIPNRYKRRILEILKPFEEDLRKLDSYDPCSIINEWAFNNLQDDYNNIIEKMKETLTEVEEVQMDSESRYIFFQIFGYEYKDEFNKPKTIYEEQKMVASFNISKL